MLNADLVFLRGAEMTRYRVFHALLLLTCLSSVRPARCEVIHGFGGVHNAYNWEWGLINDVSFDFSTQAVVPVNEGDLAWSLDMRGLPWLEFRECYGTRVASTLEDLQVAPPLGGPFGSMGFDVGPGIYVIQTSDGLYVKFRGLGHVEGGMYFLTFEYYVQMDGSPNFGPSLPVRTTTWGQVKALYR